ncbi:YlqD family protein [Cytobacillus sp. IB215316]|uniref:YlqD family protein n=1 Tax=Cytobacillus sp. IB215316 TaxID=3097354 RepID=UPI002A1844A1|nr:YlqD family protein [Cytobacillus sp. IB215316]MDX8362277.1 YlqD family protein [Cytobacillus sp. IB215316]
MKIIQNIIVKQVLTEKSKDGLLDKFQQSKFQLQKECDQLRFERKKMENNKKYQASTLHTYFEREINSRLEKIKVLDFQIEQLEILPIGSELREKEVQAIVDINVGDSWDDISHEKTIIIKEGIVVEMR